MTQDEKKKAKRGFGSMDPAKQLEIARAGGLAVPAEKRAFARDPTLAAMAGRKGGAVVRPRPRAPKQG